MSASRCSSHCTASAYDTACPPRRSCVTGDAHRRGQACTRFSPTMIACGAAFPTPAILAGVDNTQRFSGIVDD